MTSPATNVIASILTLPSSGLLDPHRERDSIKKSCNENYRKAYPRLEASEEAQARQSSPVGAALLKNESLALYVIRLCD